MRGNNYLLDTHVFIWAMEASQRLSQDIKDQITDPGNKVFISIATIWEIVIKRKIKKIKVKFDLAGSVEKADFHLLPIQISHVLNLDGLPLHHKDPFDRILIAQAKVEGLTLITSDQKFKKYEQVLVGSHNKLSLISV